MKTIYILIDPWGYIVSVSYDYEEAEQIKKKEGCAERPLSIIKIKYEILGVIN